MTGYWFANEPPGWMPDEDLLAFLEAGDAPVVITLGAMSTGGADAVQMAVLVTAAIKQADCRAIVQGWPEAADVFATQSNMLHAGSIPHNWLFNRASAIVHHGGFGTTAATFRAGKPGIVIPHIIDQFLWGQKVAELSVGPEPIPRSKLTVENLAAALKQAQIDEQMQSCAGQLGEQIRQENGLETAVRLIEETSVAQNALQDTDSCRCLFLFTDPI